MGLSAPDGSREERAAANGEVGAGQRIGNFRGRDADQVINGSNFGLLKTLDDFCNEK